jgi:galactokinase
VVDQVRTLENGDFTTFLNLVIASGRSSWMLCQNISISSNPQDQGLAVALMMSESLLKEQGAWRVHGGGFAGTIQAYVPNAMVTDYVTTIEKVFGLGSCHQLFIRPKGTTRLRELIG